MCVCECLSVCVRLEMGKRGRLRISSKGESCFERERKARGGRAAIQSLLPAVQHGMGV